MGAADSVTVLAPLPTWKAVEVALNEPSTACRMIEPALEGMMLLKTAIPEVFVDSVRVLELSRLPPLAAEIVIFWLDIGRELAPSTWT